jgi:hypothetical protein
MVSTPTLLTAPVAVAVTVTPRAADATPTGWLPNCACAAAAISNRHASANGELRARSFARCNRTAFPATPS